MGTILKVEREEDNKCIIVGVDESVDLTFEKNKFVISSNYIESLEKIYEFVKELNQNEKQFTVTLFSYGTKVHQHTYFPMQ